MKYRNLSKKRNKIIKRRKTRKLSKKSYKKLSKKYNKKSNKILIGGNPPSIIESGIPNLKIEYFTDISDLTNYLEETNYDSTDKPTCVYVTIGSKRPPLSSKQPDDTVNSGYQIIPGFFDEYEGKIFIIMLDIFEKLNPVEPGEPERNDFEEQVNTIKKRFTKYSLNNCSVHIIMCNLRFHPDAMNDYSALDRQVRSQFIDSYTKFANCLYSILHFTYDKLALETNKILICNFIRFKRPNPYESATFENSNKMINWALGGNPIIKRGEDFLTTMHIEPSTVRRYESRGLLTNKHYIWAGYKFVNLIYKYIDMTIFEAKIDTTIRSIKIEPYKNIQIYGQDYVQDSGQTQCSTLFENKNNPAITPIYQLFFPFVIGKGENQKTINLRIIDFTSPAYIRESIFDDTNENICEFMLN